MNTQKTPDTVRKMLDDCKKKAGIIIGIDPDVDRNGYAELEKATRRLKVAMYEFPLLTKALQSAKDMCDASGQTLMVYIEAGWLNKSNYHLRPTDNRQIIAAKGVSQGRNEQVSKMIGEWCEYANIPYEFIKPLTKCWSGKDRKITQTEIETITEQRLGRLNQEGRDAALIAWNYAGLPIRVSVNTIFGALGRAARITKNNRDKKKF